MNLLEGLRPNVETFYLSSESAGRLADLANHWQPPQFLGRSWHRWHLPADLQAMKSPGD
ncbi:hypothetical protein J2X16_000687 [Pelomonas aquatica]|uniref:Uncharacterized protein n=1 Tax=Pelomonas aquatica TaxID=431058 RepID=A0ABU1Z5R5_9BURK|nr:hypothetical protein [Pelomonas aquatica]MDR7295366.1 hypothetical protein [Pelomonas aquatica]